jgi:hypothetical protein
MLTMPAWSQSAPEQKGQISNSIENLEISQQLGTIILKLTMAQP